MQWRPIPFILSLHYLCFYWTVMTMPLTFFPFNVWLCSMVVFWISTWKYLQDPLDMLSLRWAYFAMVWFCKNSILLWGLLLNTYNCAITLFSFKTYFRSCFNHSNQTDWYNLFWCHQTFGANKKNDAFIVWGSTWCWWCNLWPWWV